jgi:hypothetical protein
MKFIFYYNYVMEFYLQIKYDDDDYPLYLLRLRDYLDFFKIVFMCSKSIENHHSFDDLGG